MDSQRSSPAPQFENISSLVLNILYSPAFISVPEYWRNIALTIWRFLAKWCLCFLIYCLGCHSFLSMEQASFNFMTTVTICNDFEAQEKKICHCFHFPPLSICHEVIGPNVMIFVFSVLSFKPAFTLLFHLHQEALQFLHFLPLSWHHLHIWGCWYFSQ